jgi:hypothetical protein
MLLYIYPSLIYLFVVIFYGMKSGYPPVFSGGGGCPDCGDFPIPRIQVLVLARRVVLGFGVRRGSGQNFYCLEDNLGLLLDERERVRECVCVCVPSTTASTRQRNYDSVCLYVIKTTERERERERMCVCVCPQYYSKH